MKSAKFDLIQFVAEKLEEHRNAPKEYKSKPSIKPSELSSPCLRKNYYTFYRVESDSTYTFKNIATFESGDIFHAKVRAWLKESGLLVENLDKKTGKVPLSFINNEPDPEFIVQDPDLWIRWAKADGILKITEEGDKKGLWVLEIKSKKDSKFEDVTSPDRDRYQGMLYAYVLESALQNGKLKHIPELVNETEILGTVYIYINRNEASEWKVYWDYKDLEFFQDKLLEKIAQLQDHVLSDTLPKKTPDFCKWCNYKSKCDKNWKPEKQDPNF